MSLINPAILYGLGLASIPVILHLLMRSRPKKLLFPALRLIQMRRKTNVRRLRLRHLWLLLLRVAVIGLIVLAVARPSLPAANYAPNLYEWLGTGVIAALAIGAYAAVMWRWQKQRTPSPTLAYRRTVLRGGTAAGALALFLLLVVWPYQRRIAAEVSAPLPDVAQHLPVAAVFLFDTSLSMDYRFESKTRLERAREIAGTHRGNLPPGSRLAVADTGDDGPILFQADLSGAQARIDALAINPAHVPLDDRVRDAIDAQEDDHSDTLMLQDSVPESLRQDRFVREIYVFTDMARSNWRPSSQFVRDRLEKLRWVQVYLIDVGVAQPADASIPGLRLSRQTVPQGGDLLVQATIAMTGDVQGPKERTAELYVENESGKLVKQGSQPVPFSGSGVNVSCPVQGLNRKFTHGEVRLVTSDPLPGDDIRFFTVAVTPPPNVLVVSEMPEEAVWWRTALSQPELERQGRSRYRVQDRRSSELSGLELGQYDVVCLMNVRRPTEAAWDDLREFVQNGGGLAVVLGMPNGDDSPSAVAYNGDTPQSFLPAELLADLKFAPPEHLDLRNLTHPILERFETFGVGELTSVPVRRYWRVAPAAAAAVVSTYTDTHASPAILERTYGKGRTVMFTTAMDLLHEWNEIPSKWSFVALADQTMQHLSRAGSNSYNYTAGEDVTLRLDKDRPAGRVLLRKPKFQQIPIAVSDQSEVVTISESDQLGHYDLAADSDTPAILGGFSVNFPGGESDFTRLTGDDLDKIFGQERYRVAANTDVLERFIAEGRLGREVFSLLLAAVIIAFCAEHLVANRFYDSEQAPAAE